MSIEAMKLALEALELTSRNYREQRHAVSVLSQAIEQAEQAQPVAFAWKVSPESPHWQFSSEPHKVATVVRPLVFGDTAPPPRQWVGLTDEDFRAMGYPSRPRVYDAIEAKLKEKNT